MRVISGALVLLVAVALSACGDGADGQAAARPSAERPHGNQVIEPRRAIAGIRLDVSADEVGDVLGKPDATAPSELHGGWVTWEYRDSHLRVTLDERRHVWDVRTYSAADRTPTGVGVGSTEREVGEAMRFVRCEPYGGPARYRRWRVCVDTRTYRGPFTSFTLVSGRVRYVTVARGLAE